MVAAVSKEALDVVELREFLGILSAVILNTWRTNNNKKPSQYDYDLKKAKQHK